MKMSFMLILSTVSMIILVMTLTIIDATDPTYFVGDEGSSYMLEALQHTYYIKDLTVIKNLAQNKTISEVNDALYQTPDNAVNDFGEKLTSETNSSSILGIDFSKLTQAVDIFFNTFSALGDFFTSLTVYLGAPLFLLSVLKVPMIFYFIFMPLYIIGWIIALLNLVKPSVL